MPAVRRGASEPFPLQTCSGGFGCRQEGAPSGQREGCCTRQRRTEAAAGGWKERPVLGTASPLSRGPGGHSATEPVPTEARAANGSGAWHLPAGTLAWFHPRQGGDRPWAWRIGRPASGGGSCPLTARQVSSRPQPRGFCPVAERDEGAARSCWRGGRLRRGREPQRMPCLVLRGNPRQSLLLRS